ncbi:hypothetical protein B0H15DRAFT_785085 [Mycena belliarum]|uniref:Uncharacterized protein n=1 Tax=Mycena belliarum TaxID=1033014 RepID=A0AAD6TZZ2_9AGAR|nr:hypothetical protein B0H15DRAFT_785085 [Mycena belliae]
MDHRIEERVVRLNRETTLEVLYSYPLDATVEYPETSSTGFVGHLFRINPKKWENPVLNIAYSRGKPGGQTVAGREKTTEILLSSQTGESVPCVLSHTTCTFLSDVKERLQNDRDERVQSSSPSKDVFLRTSAYLSALQKLGCSRPLCETTFLSATEEEERDARDLYLFQTQRGYRMKEGICEGRIVFDYDERGVPYISCEHYKPTSNKDHFHDHGIHHGAYDIDYLEAVITGDMEEAARIEDLARDQGYGPCVECTTVSNFSTQKANCPVPHRDPNGALIQPLLQRLPCLSKFRVYEPLEEYRTECPFILIVTGGVHTHPVPLPTKTPPQVRSALMTLFDQLGEDLPDITPRRFIRHPIVKAFLRNKFPDIVSPTLADWHVSLSNRSHVRAYIKQALEIHYPFGTGWAGVVNLREYQDTHLPKESHYIRRILALNIDPEDDVDEDEDPVDKKDNLLRIIVCMTPEASRRLLRSGRYLQSDIGFKRIIGFKEFEVAGMERDANTSLTFIRIFLNRMSAHAHQRVFEEIEAIVFEDTGSHIKWHHVHGTGPDDYGSMILSWAADQHRGQAKGLGLHLQKIAASLPKKRDLYETNRFIQDLSPYEHLHRIYRVCTVHYYRLVQLAAVPEQVRWLMRSLVCLEHANWQTTLDEISARGGKVAQDWLNNKLSSGFVFEGICWEKSFIPLEIWNAGDSNSNLVESVHRDVNQDGVHCTLVGGLKKGQNFDTLKFKSLEVYENFGIRPSYKTGHISENALVNLKRRDNQKHKYIAAEDDKLVAMNQKIQTALDKLVHAGRAVEAKERQLEKEKDISKRSRLEAEISKKTVAESKARNALEKLTSKAKELEATGSGRVVIARQLIGGGC